MRAAEANKQTLIPHAGLYEETWSVGLLLTDHNGKVVAGGSHKDGGLTVPKISAMEIALDLDDFESVQCTPKETLKSHPKELVVSRGCSSVRFRDRDSVTWKGTVSLPEEPGGNTFEEVTGNRLKIHIDPNLNSTLTVYTEKDNPHDESHGVLVIAPNIISAEDLVKCERVRFTCKRTDGGTFHVSIKGPKLCHDGDRLQSTILLPNGGWFYGPHSEEWFQPPDCVEIPGAMQSGLNVANPDDIVISRGHGTVLLRSNGECESRGSVIVLQLPVPAVSPQDHGVKPVVIFC